MSGIQASPLRPPPRSPRVAPPSSPRVAPPIPRASPRDCGGNSTPRRGPPQKQVERVMFYDTRDSNVWRELLKKEERHVARTRRPETAPVTLERKVTYPMPPTTLSRMLATMHSEDLRDTAASKLLRKQAGRGREPAVPDEWNLTAAGTDFVPKLRLSNNPKVHHVLMSSARSTPRGEDSSWAMGESNIWVPARPGTQPSWEPRHTARRARNHEAGVSEARTARLGSLPRPEPLPLLSSSPPLPLSSHLTGSMRRSQAT